MPKIFNLAPRFQIRNQTPESVQIDIMGDIGWWGLQAVDFRDTLTTIGKDSKINLHIFSSGGDTQEGFEIFNLLKAHPGGCDVEIGAMCASMATVIAMCGGHIKMAANGLFMIHNPWTCVSGDSKECRQAADVMDKIKAGIVGAYKAKTGLSDDDLSAMMDETTWMSAEEAKKKGFVDEIIDDDEEGEAEIQNRLQFMRFANSAKFTSFFQARASKHKPEGESASGNASGQQAQPERKPQPKPKTSNNLFQDYMKGNTRIFNSLGILSGPAVYFEEPDDTHPAGGVASAAEIKVEAQRLYKAKIARDAEIKAICDLYAKKTGKTFSKLRDKFISDDKTADEFRAALFSAEDSEADPAPAKPQNRANSDIVGSGIELIEPLDTLKGTPGFAFVTSTTFKAIAENTKKGGRFQGNSGPVEVPLNRAALHVVNAAGDPVTTTGLTSIQKLPEVFGMGVRPLRIEELFAGGTTGERTVRHIRENTYTQAAGAVGETDALPGMQIDLAEADANVKAIGAFVPMSEEMLVDFPAVASFINVRLPYQVDRTVDDQLLNGDGQGANILGVTQTTVPTTGSAIQTIDISAIKNKVGPELALARRMLTLIRWQQLTANAAQGGYEPNGYVIHPEDWEFFELLQDAVGQFYRVNPFNMTPGRESLWGKPVAISPATPQGTMLAGSFDMGAQIFNRQGMTIEMSNSDGDNFKKRIITLRGARRLALAIYRPTAFVQGTGINPAAAE